MPLTDSTQRVPFIKVGSSARYSAICSRDSWNLCFIHWWTWAPGILDNHIETKNLTLDFPMVSEVYSLNCWSDRNFKCFQFLLRKTYISLIKKETKSIGSFNFYRMKYNFFFSFVEYLFFTWDVGFYRQIVGGGVRNAWINFFFFQYVVLRLVTQSSDLKILVEITYLQHQ